ncbi:MAG: 4-(cytidine 5'-diphospho)-2-C-methyl-D-erythritol kinase [Flavobacteriales bacterium]|jgi:4-diphosphocytidyl-2-C-methyl-D-erythritol kinase|nr:4-(cytidine 5'-diphospho)-2-C-methyl-D-erythritol kinase [Flavobacteriales bacterium]
MVLFPHAKINLGLNVVRRRDDGFHELESVMVPIPWHDALEILPDGDLAPGDLVFHRTGLPVPGAPTEDLCWKAVKLFGTHRPLPGLRMHLHKAVPLGAGLGGGSSDAAHVLRLLNALVEDPLPAPGSHAMAAMLGSDCAFFLRDTAQLARGRGEELHPVAPPLAGLHLLVVVPPVHVPTAEVYRHCTPTGRVLGLEAVLRDAPLDRWTDLVPNTLEPHVLATRPPVAAARAALVRAGAAYVSMSGSGAAVFGVFTGPPPVLPWPAGHTVRSFAM